MLMSKPLLPSLLLHAREDGGEEFPVGKHDTSNREAFGASKEEIAEVRDCSKEGEESRIYKIKCLWNTIAKCKLHVLETWKSYSSFARNRRRDDSSDGEKRRQQRWGEIERYVLQAMILQPIGDKGIAILGVTPSVASQHLIRALALKSSLNMDCGDYSFWGDQHQENPLDLKTKSIWFLDFGSDEVTQICSLPYALNALKQPVYTY
ncbi:hypothetical protein L1987_88063 [Smallanthus sonchifolius]|nr:hypothetical protein L1987_88063 [Smallanthus sonchifolius]